MHLKQIKQIKNDNKHDIKFDRAKKERNLGSFQVGVCCKKSVYTSFYWRTHLRFKLEFQEKNKNKNPRCLKSAYVGIWVCTRHNPCVCILRQIRVLHRFVENERDRTHNEARTNIFWREF